MTQITAHTEANGRSPCSKGTALLFSRKSLCANLHFLTVYMMNSLAGNNPRALIQRQLPIYVLRTRPNVPLKQKAFFSPCADSAAQKEDASAFLVCPPSIKMIQ
jgi:hypothetical protein